MVMSTFRPVPLPVVEFCVWLVYVPSLGEPARVGVSVDNTEPILSPFTPFILLLELVS